MSYQSDTLGFSKKPILGYIPPNHSLFGKHFKHHTAKDNTPRPGSNFNAPAFRINLKLAKTLKTKKYPLLIIALACVAVVISGWAVQNYRLKTYQTRLNEIQTLKQQADALIQANQPDLAREKLIFSLDQLNKLPAKTTSSDNAYTDLKQSITSVLRQVNHITFIDQPTVFLDFQTLLPQAKDTLKISNLGLRGNIMYTTEASQAKIYRLDLEKFLIAEADAPAGQMNQISQIINTPDGVMFINYQTSLFAYTPGQGFNLLDTSLVQAEFSQTTSLAYYNDKLYALNPAAGQIRKYIINAQDQLTDGQNWLTDDQTDLSDAVSLAVDGDIYVMRQNGRILKLSGGVPTAFDTDIHPAIQTRAQIFTSPEHQYLYILEPALYRLIMLDKTGRLITQFNSVQFDDLQGFYPDEKHNIIYLLNTNRVYQIEKYLPEAQITLE